MTVSSASVVQARVAAEPISEEVVEGFAVRRRIVLHEPYPPLRSVIARNLTRRGCIVTFRRSPDDVCALLQQCDAWHGAVVGLDEDPATAAQQIERLRAANHRQVPVVLLTVWTVRPEQRAAWRSAGMTGLEKPFDIRDLLASLSL